MSRSRLVRRRLVGQVPEPAARPGALDVVSDYAAAIIARDQDRLKALRARSYVLDLVHLDAFKIAPQGPGAGEAMYAALFAAFPDSDFEVLRTIAGEAVVVQEWRFSGRHTGPLLSAGPVPGAVAPTGRQVRLRGVSIYEATGGKIVRETMYLDNATWAVELGVTP